MGSKRLGPERGQGPWELEGSQHLEAHLLGLLRIHGSHMLVVPQGVPLLLLLCPQVAPQCQQDALCLWKGWTLPGLPQAFSPSALFPHGSHT